jgi:spore germination protein KC
MVETKKNKIRTRLICGGLFCLCITLLSGCWNKTELSDLAFVMAIGVDKAKDRKGYEVTYQVVIPGNVTSGMSGGNAQGLPVTIYSSTSENLLEAGRKTTTKVSRRLYFAHTTLIVINEEVAKEGIAPLLDVVERDPEIRTTTRVVVAKNNPAKDIVSTLTPLDKLPAEKMTKSIQVTERSWGANADINVDDIIMALVSSGKDPIISGFTILGSSKEGEKLSSIEATQSASILQAEGLAIFNGDKLSGWMNGKSAIGVQRINKNLKGTVEYVDWKGKPNAIGLKILRSKTKVSAIVKNGKPKIVVEIKEEGNIGETIVPIDLTNPKLYPKLQKEFDNKIKSEVLETINEAKELNSDIFGFGEAFHKSHPHYWKEVKSDWESVFSDLEVEVKVNTYIRRTGLRSKSFLSSFTD